MAKLDEESLKHIMYELGYVGGEYDATRGREAMPVEWYEETIIALIEELRRWRTAFDHARRGVVK